jgi:hypothetical protein
VIGQANVFFDPSEPQIFETVVESKHISGGKTTTYYLKLEPWGPRAERADTSVEPEVYNVVQPGGKVCVVLFSGAFKIRWFAVIPCRR